MLSLDSRGLRLTFKALLETSSCPGGLQYRSLHHNGSSSYAIEPVSLAPCALVLASHTP